MRKDILVTVTLNPCIDKTVTVDGFVTGGLNRIIASRYDLSGKGINLSKAYRALGGQTTASGLMPAGDAETYYRALTQQGIGHDFTEISGKVRENLKVCDARTSAITEINEPGCTPTEADLQSLLGKIETQAKTSWAMAFSGSIPPGCPADIYQRLVSAAKAGGALTVLDCDGEPMRLGMKAEPEIIKPNLFELEQIAGKSLATQAEIADAARGIIRTHGVRYAAVTLGENGAMLVTKEAAYFAKPLDLDVRSATGAGDTFVAGFLTALRMGSDVPDMLRWGMAAAGDAVTREGTQVCTKTGTEALLESVRIEAI